MYQKLKEFPKQEFQPGVIENSGQMGEGLVRKQSSKTGWAESGKRSKGGSVRKHRVVLGEQGCVSQETPCQIVGGCKVVKGIRFGESANTVEFGLLERMR